MFFAHWAATEPRETVVSSVRSESGSAERAIDDTPEADYSPLCFVKIQLLCGWARRVGSAWYDRRSDRSWQRIRLGARVAAACQTNNKCRRQNTLDEQAEPRLHHPPPNNPHPLRNRADPGGQKGQGCLTTLVPGGTAQSWRGNLCITTAPQLEPPVRRAPEHNRYRLNRTPRVQRPCCPRKHR
jgi:hypothetical protein